MCVTPALPARCRKFATGSCGARQQQRRTRQHGAKVDLQAAVAANVVKRAPDHSVSCSALAGVNGSRQAGQRVQHHLGPAGCARGEQNPLRIMTRGATVSRNDLSIGMNERG